MRSTPPPRTGRRGPLRGAGVVVRSRAHPHLVSEVDELLLATDEDREGEAIAWHLLQVLEPKVPVRRMVFHEITREAIQRALTDTLAEKLAPARRESRSFRR